MSIKFTQIIERDFSLSKTYRMWYNMDTKGGVVMNSDLILELKHLKACLVKIEMTGDELEEKQAMIQKIEELTDYLNDAEERGIEFQ